MRMHSVQGFEKTIVFVKDFDSHPLAIHRFIFLLNFDPAFILPK